MEPQPVTIRHIRYEDFISVASAGEPDLDAVRSAVDAVVGRIGDVASHDVVVDLRRAVLPPLPEPVLGEALESLRRAGLGVRNRVAVVISPHDLERLGRMRPIERIAGDREMALGMFDDYGDALDWLSEADRVRPGASAE
jgi:hypothetical protein